MTNNTAQIKCVFEDGVFEEVVFEDEPLDIDNGCGDSDTDIEIMTNNTAQIKCVFEDVVFEDEPLDIDNGCGDSDTDIESDASASTGNPDAVTSISISDPNKPAPHNHHVSGSVSRRITTGICLTVLFVVAATALLWFFIYAVAEHTSKDHTSKDLYDVNMNIGSHSHNLCLGQDNDSVPEAKMDQLVDTEVMGTQSCGELHHALMEGIVPMNLCPRIQELAGPICCSHSMHHSHNLCLGQDNDSFPEAKMDQLVDTEVMGIQSCGEVHHALMEGIVPMNLFPRIQELAGPICCSHSMYHSHNLCLGQDNDSVPEAKMDELVDTDVMGIRRCGELHHALMEGIVPMNLCPRIQELAGPVCCNNN